MARYGKAAPLRQLKPLMSRQTGLAKQGLDRLLETSVRIANGHQVVTHETAPQVEYRDQQAAAAHVARRDLVSVGTHN